MDVVPKLFVDAEVEFLSLPQFLLPEHSQFNFVGIDLIARKYREAHVLVFVNDVRDPGPNHKAVGAVFGLGFGVVAAHQKEIQLMVEAFGRQRLEMQIGLSQTIRIQRRFVFSIRPELVEIDSIWF